MTKLALSHQIESGSIMERFLGGQRPITSINSYIVSDVPISTYLGFPEDYQKDYVDIKTSVNSGSDGEKHRNTYLVTANHPEKSPFFASGRDCIFPHLETIDYVASKVPDPEITNEKSRFLNHPVLIQKEGESVSLITKVRLPKAYFTSGLEFEGQKVSDFHIRSSLTGGGYQRAILSQSGDTIPYTFRHFPEQDLIELQDKSLRQVLKEIERQYSHRAGDLFDWEDFQERIFPDLTRVDYWDSRAEDLTSSAKHLSSLIRNSSLGGHIRDVILYGSLARNDKIPYDIDMVLIVHDPQRKVLNPMNHSTEERRTSRRAHLQRYNVNDVTDGLLKELGIVDPLKRYSLETHGAPRDEWDERWHSEEPHSIPLGKHGARVNLNTIYTDDIFSAKHLETMMRSKRTPGYFRDILKDGVILGDYLMPAGAKYAQELGTAERLLQKAIDERWPNHVNDTRFRGL